MSAAVSDPDGRRPIAGQKRPVGASDVNSAKLPRRSRGRAPLRPITNGSFAAQLDLDDEADSSSCCFQTDYSTESSLVFPGPKRLRAPATNVSSVDEVPASGSRRITRSYSRRTKEERSARNPKRSKVAEDDESGFPAAKTSVSEASASEVFGGFPGGNQVKKADASFSAEKEPELSVSYCFDSVTDASGSKIGKPSAATDEEAARSQISQNSVTRVDDRHDCDLESDLGCSERLSDEIDEEEEENEGSSEYSTGNEFSLSDLESELFCGSLERDLFDDCYCSSDVAATSSSSDEFTDGSRVTAGHSATFSLFLRLGQQFTRSSYRVDPGTHRDFSPEFTMMRFEEEDEESYEMLRSRERTEAAVRDYMEEYGGASDCGDLILEQRLLMVNWMVEHASAMELQSETLFLGVSLMDRFLSRGYFNSERHLQVLGIACITLATRIEENQPYNSIRQISFKVKNNFYSRSEVVAMEWLVQEVLKFKCLVPTMHHFLWFYLKAARADAHVQNLSRYLAVLSLLDHERLSFWPSSIAAGLVILACLVTNHDDSCQMVMETHVRTKNDDLPESMQCLQWLVKYAC